jgi:hypothetical protein
VFNLDDLLKMSLDQQVAAALTVHGDAFWFVVGMITAELAKEGDTQLAHVLFNAAEAFDERKCKTLLRNLAFKIP